ncbi:MAG: xanthine dehydrogenase family protein subunit M [Elusimicrobia bacterium]|nr:xanthine dehydrogenase family protein subunit M [Elusimicrobiota bacterium]
MRGDSASMKVLRPATADEAVRMYARAPKALPVAGGTDVMVLWNAGLLNGRVVLDLWGVEEWRKIRVRKDGILIGALATHARLREHPAIREKFPLLSEACATVGAEQIQNRGTIGGNVANASPAGDTFPALAVYEAVVHVASAKGRRTLPLSQVFAGVKKTALAPGELIEAIFLPMLPRRPDRRVFRKVGQRAAQTISKTVGAAVLFLNKDGTVEELRVAFGSVAPTVRRLRAAEDALKGRLLTAASAEEACGLIERDISPIDDMRSTREYRLRVTRNILRAFLWS